MSTTSDITKTARKRVRKATPAAEKAMSPKNLAAAGAALIALPYAAQGLSKLKGGGGGGDGKIAEAGKKAKKKATDKAKDVAGEVADEKLKPSLPKGLGGLFGGMGDD